jgi:membrane protein
MDNSGYGQKLLYLVKRLFMRYLSDDVGALAAETTYYLILGIIPFMIFLVNSILFFAAPQIHTIIRLLQYLPHDMAISMETNVYRIIATRSTVWLFIGLIGALWSASQGVDVIIRSTDKIFFTDRNKQPWIIVKLKSIVFTLLIVFAMILSLGLMVFGNGVVYALNYFFTLPDVFLDLWTILKYGIPFCNLVLSLTLFYRFAPEENHASWTLIVIASFVVTSIWLLLTAGYGYYILQISHMGVTYGSLIGLVVLFIWFHLASIVIIMGGEFIMACREVKEYFENPAVYDITEDEALEKEDEVFEILDEENSDKKKTDRSE